MKVGDFVKVYVPNSTDRGIILSIDRDGTALILWNDGIQDWVHTNDLILVKNEKITFGNNS